MEIVTQIIECSWLSYGYTYYEEGELYVPDKSAIPDSSPTLTPKFIDFSFVYCPYIPIHYF